MNPLLILPALPGVLVGCAIALLLLRRAPRTIQPGDTLTRLDIAHQPHRPDPHRARATVRLGRWLHVHLPAVPGLSAPTNALDLLEIPPGDLALQKAILAVAGMMAPALLSGLLGAVLGQPVLLPLVLCPLLAAVFWLTPDLRVRAMAAARRREFTRFVATYLELVAVALLGNTTADAALASAATVSDAWAFARIRREYQIADATRTTKWVALERLSDTLGVPALGEVARIMRLSEAHVSVRDQLRAACDKLRLTVVNDDAIDAQRVSNQMQVPIVLTILPVLALVLIPTVLQLTSSGL